MSSPPEKLLQKMKCKYIPVRSRVTLTARHSIAVARRRDERDERLHELLRDQTGGGQPHSGQDPEQRGEGAEGRTLFHGSNDFSGRAPERFDVRV
jgi:hypothetical protein